MSYTKTPYPVVLRTIPISNKLKRYYWNKYQFLRAHNGPAYAAEIFSQLRVVVMRYISDESRHYKLEHYIKECPVRKNGWLRTLFMYADNQPQHVIQFLKLYTSEKEPALSVEEAAAKQAQILNEATSPIDQPWKIRMWSKMLSLPLGVWEKEIRLHSKYPFLIHDGILTVYHLGKTYTFPERKLPASSEDYWWSKWLVEYVYPLLKSKGPKRFISYIRKWKGLLRVPNIPEDGLKMAMMKAIPTPRSYIETEFGSKVSKEHATYSFEEDVMSFFSIIRNFREDSFSPILGMLPEEVFEFEGEINDSFDDYTVGSIHCIPKKGTVKRRSIAAPNRMFQACTAPCYKWLSVLANRLPNSCMKDQSKMDRSIKHHLEKDDGYTGSVDLSQATDWLPFSWFQLLADTFEWFPDNSLSKWSYSVYQWLCRAKWDLLGEPVSWKRGQPLGTWPSFNVLTITHYIVAEVMAFTSRKLDSPFALLGDDIVFFSKKTRDNYIDFMESEGNPLSLHKSYDGRLVEFAGKNFIIHQPTVYSPNASPIYWNNIFDYQRSTLRAISFDDLPRLVQDRFRSECLKRHLSPNQVVPLYIAMQLVQGIPTHYPNGFKESIDSYLIQYFSSEEKIEPEFLKDNGFFLIDDSIGSWNIPTTYKPGRKSWSWYRDKYRPVSVDSMFSRMLDH